MFGVYSSGGPGWSIVAPLVRVTLLNPVLGRMHWLVSRSGYWSGPNDSNSRSPFATFPSESGSTRFAGRETRVWGQVIESNPERLDDSCLLQRAVVDCLGLGLSSEIVNPPGANASGSLGIGKLAGCWADPFRGVHDD